MTDQLLVGVSKDKVLVSFKKKFSEAFCLLKLMEPYSPWQNAKDGMIRYLKRRTGRNITKSRGPKKS